MIRRILLALLLSISSAHSNAAPTATAADINVLFVGNSLTYVNNLPALFTALAAKQTNGPSVHADLIAAPGGIIAERWQDGFAAREIAGGHWQVLVLQEQGGLLACLSKPAQRNEPTCAASVSAHKKFSKLAHEHGMRVIVLGTWGPDAIWQSQLSRGLRLLASNIDAEPLDTGPVVRAFAEAHPQTAMYSDAILHPTLDTSLLMAAKLYREISDRSPEATDLEITAPLLAGNATIVASQLFSTQPGSAGDDAITKVGASRLQPLIAAVIADQEQHRHE